MTLTNAQLRINKKHQVSEIIVIFSGSLNGTQAEEARGIYRLATAGKKGSYTAKNAGIIKIRSVLYTQATNTVVLIPKRPFARVKNVQLEISGVSPSGLHDSIGRLIDGDHNGTAGGDAIAIISKRGATVDAEAAARTSGRIVAISALDALLEDDGIPRSRRPTRTRRDAGLVRSGEAPSHSNKHHLLRREQQPE